MNVVITSLLISVISLNSPSRKYFDSISAITDTTITITPPANSIKTTIELRYKLKKKHNSLTILWHKVCNDTTLLTSASLSTHSESPDPNFPGDYAILTFDSTETRIDNLVPNHNGYISLTATVTPSQTTFHSNDRHILTTPSQISPNGTIYLKANGTCNFKYIILESTPDLAANLTTHYTAQQLDELVNATPPQGIYTYLDRDTDSRRALAGGRYTLAVIKNDNNTFDIVYIDGAQINSPAWHKGMRKGILKPTIFADHYDLVWYDSMFNPITLDCNASIEQNAILTLNFPLLKSSIRFSKVIPQAEDR